MARRREEAMAACRSCGLPVKVVFIDGEISEVIAVCRHVQMLEEVAPR